MQIQKFKDLTQKAFKEIKEYQTGVKGVVKTGLPYFDDIFPVVNGSVIVFSAGFIFNRMMHFMISAIATESLFRKKFLCGDPKLRPMHL